MADFDPTQSVAASGLSVKWLGGANRAQDWAIRSAAVGDERSYRQPAAGKPGRSEEALTARRAIGTADTHQL
jgi:hypothetical protein